MYQTIRKIFINLLILAQIMVLWQGAFAASFVQLDNVDTGHTNCHQTTISKQVSPMATQVLEHDHTQSVYDNCCGDDCQCDHCVCFNIALIPSFPPKSISTEVLNQIPFSFLSDWQPVSLFKPPR